MGEKMCKSKKGSMQKSVNTADHHHRAHTETQDRAHSKLFFSPPRISRDSSKPHFWNIIVLSFWV